MKSSSLPELNPHLIFSQHVYRDPSLNESDFGLSSYLSIAVPRLFASIDDKRLFSYELEQALDTPELRDEFLPTPHNILRVCDFATMPARNRALDLSQEMGATAHYLAEYFDHVDAVKSSRHRTQISQQRFAHADTITHVACGLDNIVFPERSYDCIYLGPLEHLNPPLEKLDQFIARLGQSLTDHGVLLFSVLNKKRLSSWLNTDRHESDPATPYLELYHPESKIALGLSELCDVLNQADLETPNIYASFCSRNTISNLFCLDYLTQNRNALNHFYRIGSVANPSLNEYLLYKALQCQGQPLSQFASRFQVCIGRNSTHTRAVYQRDFCHFPGRSRRPEWRAITSKASDSSAVIKQRTLPNLKRTNSLLSQNLAPQTFRSGPLLIDEWLGAITRKDSCLFAKLARDYYQWLCKLAAEQGPINHYYDCLPFNVVLKCEEVVTTGGAQNTPNIDSYQIIDPEWRVDEALTPDFILFRALFWFAFENRALMADFSEHWGLTNIGAFVGHYMKFLDNAVDLEAHIGLEERVQLQISHTFNSGSVSLAMHQNFTDAIVTDNSQAHIRITTQITWADKHDLFDQANTLNLEWSSDANPMSLECGFSLSDEGKSILRVDPIDQAGLFQFESISLNDRSGQIIWSLSSSEQIADKAQLRNVIVADRISDTGKNFISLNEDPYFLFDLSHLLTDKTLLSKIASVSLSIALPQDENDRAALEKLRSVVNQQTRSIQKLGNKAHETRADIDQLNAQIERNRHERLHLIQQLEELNQIKELNQQLHLKLLNTPSRRLKRLFKGLVGKNNSH